MGMIECQLCPKYCHIPEGGAGDCRIRFNIDGKLVAGTWGLPCAVHMDPVEKKPLFHFLPGTKICSIATVGCNLHCANCQNHSISQAAPDEVEAYHIDPDLLVSIALRERAPSVAYTYTEPVAWYEYTYDCCVKVREAGMRNVLVTAGFINEKPARRLFSLVDAANVDLKAFNDAFYRNNCKGNLKPVLRTLELCLEMGVWLEVTYLIIPTLNDSMEEISKMCKWYMKRLGPTVPLHFSRFYPAHRLGNLPPTPRSTLEKARDLALDAGLYHVYVGNLRTKHGEDTFCPNRDCPERDEPLIQRIGYTIIKNRLSNGRCPACGCEVPGVWK